MTEAFYRPVTEHRFASTDHTVGPWSPEAQHFGPPAALLAREMERLPADRAVLLARVTVEILGALPIGEVVLSAELERPGRSVEMVAATLHCAGRAVARARGWRVTCSDTAAAAQGETPALPGPDRGVPLERPDNWGGGYIDAMEWRSLAGGFATPGPCTVWVRQRVALVAGEQPSAWQRALTVADSGNGVSGLLDPARWFFINSELTVHLHRPPAGEWIGLDAATAVGPHGSGTASSQLHDRQGQFGRGAQALLVRPRADASTPRAG